MTKPLPELNPSTYINRELSTIRFQERVLELAEIPTIPLLERLKFLAIVGNNLDEFFMVRIASYIQKIQMGISSTRPDGYTPEQLLMQTREEILHLMARQRRILNQVWVELERENIRIIKPQALSPELKHALKDYFLEAIFPVLTPLAVDHARPFPFISNLSLNLGVFLERRDDDPELNLDLARIKVPVPDVLPRLVHLNKILPDHLKEVLDGDNFLWIEDVILEYLALLFPGMHVVEAFPFRVLRNADIDYEHEQEIEEESERLDVMSIIEQSVRERRFGSVVRVSVPSNISERMLRRILDGLEVHSQTSVYTIDGALGSANLMELASINRPDLKYTPYVPKIPEMIVAEPEIFTAIRKQDIILHHPFDSFGPVEEFFRSAARDPAVLAIKATLYRVGKNSPIVNALMEARDNDKQVTVLVELKARFDEENNLEWARALEAKGVHVIYGVEELPVKTHAKISLVVRREPDGVRRYLHLGTGNYNASTARLYTDLGLFTCDPVLGNDASRLFNRLTGFAPNTRYEKLLVAPDYLLSTLIDLLDHEIAAAYEGKPTRIIMKMNQLEEDRIIQKLYEASQAGIKIDLIVRGFCCLRPGIEGVSDNIRVISIVGRYLEHSRAYYFQNAPADLQLLLGSADIMRRNLYNRVEVVFPVMDSRIRRRIMRLLATNLRDNINTWELQSDGTYVKLEPGVDEIRVNSQEIFMQNSFGLNLLP